MISEISDISSLSSEMPSLAISGVLRMKMQIRHPRAPDNGSFGASKSKAVFQNTLPVQRFGAYYDADVTKQFSMFDGVCVALLRDITRGLGEMYDGTGSVSLGIFV